MTLIKTSPFLGLGTGIYFTYSFPGATMTNAHYIAGIFPSFYKYSSLSYFNTFINSLRLIGK